MTHSCIGLMNVRWTSLRRDDYTIDDYAIHYID